MNQRVRGSKKEDESVEMQERKKENGREKDQLCSKDE